MQIEIARRQFMGLLSSIFRSKKQNNYVDAGALLIRTLAEALPLEEWRHGVPAYTVAELAAIDYALSSFQAMADKAVGAKGAVFHPEIIEPIKLRLTAEGLGTLASQGWRLSDWKDRVSTYMKSWLASPAPQTLLEVAEILARAGYKQEAKRTYEVVLLFPSYAPRFFGTAKDTARLVERIVENAQTALSGL
jgi:hypothetical protein